MSKVDISQITLEEFTVGDSKALVLQRVKEGIDAKIAGTKVDVDYEVISETNYTSYVYVTALPESTKITGEFKTNIKKFDLGNIDNIYMDTDTPMYVIYDLIKTTIRKRVPTTPKAQAYTDYTVQGDSSAAGSITIKANPQSLILTGEFEIIIRD
ncbi:hypothetical protein ELUMI_v1c06620 [Williamsoniiplasma luminosum]|uniref:Uncharacterized protein n=1 Tax=Williamsoniiplasma luminosum TaxID=214888 RepID=A0A2K8NUE2_9MOLU|nr:hypothetical protein [Williamsoniiplasma luminosum]ATZ17384.1 hypothetical protein ELUMI_v1c06620 [Williamsoniiplasma luminosum]